MTFHAPENKMAFNKYRDISREDGTVFVLENVPQNYNEDLITNYVEATLDVDVQEVKLYPFLQGRALVYLENKLKDFSKAKEKIAKDCLETKKVKLLQASREAAVVVNSIDFQKLSEEFLHLYFESEFADGSNIVESSKAWPDLKMAVVYFNPRQKAVVEKILKSSDLVPLPSEDYHIYVQPCYANFHEYIGQQIHHEVAETINIAEENVVEEYAQKEMEEDTEEETGEDDDEDDDVSEDKDTEEDTDKSDNEEIKNENKNKDYDDESETDSSEESDSDRKYGKVGPALNQGVNRDKNKDAAATSRQRSSVRGGFRGRGTQALRGGLTASSLRKKSYEQNEEIRKDNAKSKSSSRKIASHEEENFESRYERPSGNVGYIRGRGNNHGRIGLHTLPTRSHNEDICVERKSEINKANNTKSHNCRGRGGAVFHLSEQGKSFQTSGLPVCNERFDQSEIHGNWNLNAPIFKPHMSKQCSTGHTSLENIDQDTSSSFAAGIRPQEETQGANFDHNLPADKDTFQKVEQESNNKLASDLAARDAKIKQLQEELSKKEEQSKLCSEEIEMTLWQKEFLPHCFGRFEDCHVYFIGNVAVIEGKSESVKEQQVKLLKELNKLKEGPLDITSAMHSILCKEEGKQYLLSLNTSHLSGAKVFLHDKSLLVVAKSDLALKDAIDFLNGKLNYKETSTSEAEIPTEKLLSLRFSLEEKFLVKMTWNDKQTEIYVEGIKDDVFESIREIKTCMLDHMDQEKSFTVRGLHAKLLHKFHEDKIKQCLQLVKIDEYSSTEADIDIQFKGDRKVIQQAHRNLTELQTKVMVKSWDLRSEFKKPEELMLVAKGFASDKMKKKIDAFEATNKCIVSHKLPSLESFKMGTSKKAQQTDHSKLKHRVRSQVAAPVQTETKLMLKINDTCKLVVKPYGDITEETSDVLVSVLTTHIDLRKTRVGQTFNKKCPSLWKVLQAEHAAHPTDTVLTTMGPFSHLKCQAICHIVLTPWDPNSSPAQLSTAIQSVITKAVALNAKSVSFPVLGYGRAFKFPASDVAEITLTSIKSSQFGQALEKVVLLTPDTELFKEFKNKASQHFQLSPAKDTAVQNVGATSSSVPDVTISDDEDDVDEGSVDEEDVVEVLQHDLQNSGRAEISIAVLCGSGIESMWSDLKTEILKVCLHTQYFSQDIVNFWPKDSRHHILQEAMKSYVWVESSPDRKTEKPGFIIKGEKKQVNKVLDIINKELSDFSSHLPKNPIKSPKAPKRGTCAFLKHAAESDEMYPSYWKLNSLNPEKSLLKKQKDFLSSHESEVYLVNVDSKTKEAIKKLIMNTWDPSLVGRGHDAAGLSHSQIKVIDVKRIENKHLFESYSAYRKQIFRKMYLKNKICPDIKKIPGSKGAVITTENLEDSMKEELYHEVNEHYLFHGTKSHEAITSNGIDPRVFRDGGMFGKGIYTAEQFIKSDQYTDDRTQRTPLGTTLHMILARVLLGNVFLCDNSHPSVANKQSTKLTRPPCIQCEKDICGCPNQKLYDSVMGDGNWMFREFVVYGQDHCYPEYLISYQRE